MAEGPKCLCYERAGTMPGESYICRTCGVNNICKKCVENCHKGHNVCFNSKQPFICECAISYCKKTCKCCKDPDVCTKISLPHRNPLRRQRGWRCKTCGITGNSYVCTACKERCHKGHDVVDAGLTIFECSCDAQGRECKAKVHLTDEYSESTEEEEKMEEKEEKKEKKQEKSKQHKKHHKHYKNHKHSFASPRIIVMPIILPMNPMPQMQQYPFMPQYPQMQSMMEHSLPIKSHKGSKHHKKHSSDYSTSSSSSSYGSCSE